MFLNFTLPARVSQEAYQALVETISGALAYEGDAIITDALNKANLQPTSRAVILAAQAAVSVLLAHEIGQEVAEDEKHSAYLDALADNVHVFDIAEATLAEYRHAKRQMDNWPRPEA